MKVQRSSSSRKPEDLIQSIQEKVAAAKIQSAAQLTGGYTLWCWKSLAPYCRSDAGFQALRPHMLELQSPSESQSPCWRQRDKIGAKLKQFNVETGTEPTVEADGSDGLPQSSWERTMWEKWAISGFCLLKSSPALFIGWTPDAATQGSSWPLPVMSNQSLELVFHIQLSFACTNRMRLLKVPSCLTDFMHKWS